MYGVYMACMALPNVFQINLFWPSVAFHIETSQLFCRIKQLFFITKQMTGFKVERNTGLKWFSCN